MKLILLLHFLKVATRNLRLHLWFILYFQWTELLSRIISYATWYKLFGLSSALSSPSYFRYTLCLCPSDTNHCTYCQNPFMLEGRRFSVGIPSVSLIWNLRFVMDIMLHFPDSPSGKKDLIPNWVEGLLSAISPLWGCLTYGPTFFQGQPSTKGWLTHGYKVPALLHKLS